jgi:predicted negative regulator of RcsB-dependent stress response
VEEYLDDREQWERVLAGVREQGPWVLAGPCRRMPCGVAGWRYWQTRTEQRALDAAARYQQVLAAFSRNDLSWRAQDRGQSGQGFRQLAYADQAELAGARIEVENQELDRAAARLRLVLQTTRDQPLALIVRLRLARVQLAQGKPDEALATLDALDAGAFAARYAEVRGDALLAQGDRDGALKQYRAARANGANTVDTGLLDLKINELSHP